MDAPDAGNTLVIWSCGVQGGKTLKRMSRVAGLPVKSPVMVIWAV